ncbi:response regulator receiver protein [Acinetobacter sp. CAG:196]|nr:response regulator receiver protein [Acinetobacter sp. CAG:196]
MQNSTVFVLDKNENSREIIKSFIENLDFVSEVKLYGDYNKGYEDIKLAENPLVILDISEDFAGLDEIAGKLKLVTSKIIITSINYSTNTIIKALRLGAKEFLPKPVLREDLVRVLSMLASISPENEVSQSKIITVYSNKGGIGKTTIAVNLAAELAKVTKDKVALVDLNLQLGDISTFLNLNPPFDVNYVIRRLIDKEENILIKGFEKYKDLSLYVLSDPSYIEQSESITTQQITTLFSALKKVFPYIVVDMSSNIDPISLKILDSSDWIMFTTIVNIPAIRNAQRCLNLFRSRKYPSNKVKIVINRYMENDEIKIEDIENTLGESVYWKIPNNYFTIMEAINKGVSISEVNAESNIGNSFRDFAAKVSDDIIEQSVVQYRV